MYKIWSRQFNNLPGENSPGPQGVALTRSLLEGLLKPNSWAKESGKNGPTETNQENNGRNIGIWDLLTTKNETLKIWSREP